MRERERERKGKEKLEQRRATMNEWNQKNAGISGEINVMR